MIAAGARVVAAENAKVCEYRSAERANLRWVVRRAVRNGGTIASLDWGQTTIGRRVSRLTGAAASGVGSAVRAIVEWNRDRHAAMRNLIRACEVFGKLMHAAGFRVEEYRHPS